MPSHAELDVCAHGGPDAIIFGEGFNPEGYTLYAYAAIQAFAEAAKKAVSTKLDALEKALHQGTYETVLGQITFDEKGDVKGFKLLHVPMARRQVWEIFLAVHPESDLNKSFFMTANAELRDSKSASRCPAQMPLNGSYPAGSSEGMAISTPIRRIFSARAISGWKVASSRGRQAK